MKVSSNRSWSVVALLVGLLVLPAASVVAGEESAAGLPPGSGVVVVFPGAASRGLEPPVASTPAAQAANLIELEPSDPRLSDPLRRALMAGRRSAAVNGTLEPCAPDLPRFAALVTEAGEALDFLKTAEARALLDRGWAAFACDLEAVPDATIAHFLFLSGVLNIYVNRGDKGFFGEALAIAPQLPVPTAYSKEVQKAFLEARKRLEQRKRIPVQLRTEDLAGLELRIDGARPAGSSQELPAGRRFLQLVAPDGRVVAGAVVTLPAAAESEPVVLPPPELQPPEVAASVARLEQAVQTGQPDPELAEALEAVLQAGRHPFLALVVPASAVAPARALFVQPGRVYQAKALRAPSRQKAVSRSKVGVAATAVLGAFTLGAAGYYGYSFYVAETGEFTREEADAIVFRTGVGGVCALVGGLGTLTAASLTWKFPAALYGSRREESRLERPRLNLAVMPGMLQVGVSARW